VRAGRLAAVAAALAATGLGACGGGSSSAADDPASAVPADVAIYAEAAVRPEGSLKSLLEGALSKLLGVKDVGGYVSSRVDRTLAGHGLDYSKDVEPWLGERAAVFYQSFGSRPTAAIVIQTTDSSAALAAFEKAAKADRKRPRSTSYRGVTVEAAGDDTTYATVGDLVVAGPRDGVEAAIDASKGDSLADSKDYSASLAGAPADRVFTAWADPNRVLDALVAGEKVSAEAADQLRSHAGRFLKQPIAAWGDAAKSYLGLELSLAAAPDARGAQGSLIEGFPDDSWLAFGASGFGQGFARGLRQVRSQASEQLGSGNAFLDRLREALGVDVGNVGKWLGDVSGYLRGSSIIGLGGAIVLSSRDEAASAKSLAELQQAFEHDVDVVTRPLGSGRTGFTVTPRGAPVQFVFTQRQGKVIAGLGQDSVDAALDPSKALGDSPTFKAAAGSLGGLAPSFYLDFQPIASLFSIPGVTTDPRFDQVKPYLDRLDYLVAGGGVDDGRVLARIVLGVRAGGEAGSIASARAPAYAAIGP
jgi:uncharacterized protein DUF3352